MNKKGETVCITGSSSGIGYALAMEFAKNGYDLVLTARRKEALKRLKEDIQEKYKVTVWVITEDLAKDIGAESLYRKIKEKNIQVDVLVNNAGFGYGGEFLEQSVKVDKDMATVNMYSVTMLTKLFGREMKSRKRGKILQVASTGAFHPGAYTAVYYATKAYIRSFSSAIRRELKPYNIKVSTLCPGAVKTDFAKRAGKKENKFAMDPKYVAKKAYRGLEKGKEFIVPKWYYKLLIKIPTIISGWLVERQQKRMI